MGFGSIHLERGAAGYIIYRLKIPFVLDRVGLVFDILPGKFYIHGPIDCGMQNPDANEWFSFFVAKIWMSGNTTFSMAGQWQVLRVLLN